VAAGVLVATFVVGTPAAEAAVTFPNENLDGAGNNVAHPTWGQAGTP
jgi:hypothetical protein